MSDTSEATKEKLQRVLIVGAGDTGQTLAWELQHNRSQPYRAVAFVDDDPALSSKRVHGIPVAGNRCAIPEAIRDHKIDLVAIALPPEPAPGLQKSSALEPSKVPVRLVPAAQDVLEGRASRGEMREITDGRPAGARAHGRRRGRLPRCHRRTGGPDHRRRRQHRPRADPPGHELRPGGAAPHRHQRDGPVRAARRDGAAVEPGRHGEALARAASPTAQQPEDVFETARPQVVFHLAAYKHCR